MFCSLPIAFLDAFGGSEVLLVMFLILILFGGDKLPSVAKTIGKSMRELKKASADIQEEIKKAMDEPPPAPKPVPPKTVALVVVPPPALPPPPSPPALPAPPPPLAPPPDENVEGTGH